MKREIGFLVFFVFGGPLLLLCAQGSPDSHQQLRPRRLDPGAMEKALFELVNEERAKQAVAPLRFSESLAALARRHSADLARQNTLSHVSSSGESFRDRLVRNGFFFAGTGENIVRSETYVVEVIHQSLMESPEHRENILAAEFDTIGIGVVESRIPHAYFITQDFLQSPGVLEVEAAKNGIINKIQEWRKGRSLSLIAFQNEAGNLAQRLSEARAAGTELPPIPQSLGETHVYFVITPSLKTLDEKSLHTDRADCEEGGLGVSFARSKDYPGGAYFIALVIFPKNKYLSLTLNERTEVVRKSINNIRQKRGLKDLLWDENLALEAEQIAVVVSRQGDKGLGAPAGPEQRIIFSFRSVDLGQIPREIGEKILALHLRRIGLRVIFTRMSDLSRGAFLIVGIVE